MKGFSRRLANCPQDSLPRRCGAAALFKSSSPQDQTKSPEPKFGASVCLDVTKKIPGENGIGQKNINYSNI